MISPVTFKMRFNPAATRPEPDLLPGEQPTQVDPRQTTLFGAGWTLGSIKYLSEGGADSVTYYETVGWLGVMERAGDVYPLFHVLADIGEFAGADVLRAMSSQPLVVEGFALRREGATRILLANVTEAAQHVHLPRLRGQATLHMLDEHSVALATANPQPFALNGGKSCRQLMELHLISRRSR